MRNKNTNFVSRRFFIGGATAFGAFGGARLFAAPAGAYANGTPNIKFGVLSDLHIQCVTGDRVYGGGSEAFIHALEWYRDQKVDAVVIAGDLADLGLGDELMHVAEAWFQVFPDDRAPDGRKVERIFISGNHEASVFVWNNNLKHILKLYDNDEKRVREQLLRVRPAYWWEKAFHEPYARFYHRNVKGYDFLNANWDDGTPLADKPLASFANDWHVNIETFGVELDEWLKKNGKTLDPHKPFFYQQHRQLWKTTYSDWAWNHDRGRSTQVLSNWPNAVSFAGDTHYSLTDERSIWQGAFTALGTASLRYTGLPYDSRKPQAYENSGSGKFSATYNPIKVMRDYNPSQARQGMLISVYDDRMVVQRREFVFDSSLGDDWVIPIGEKRPFDFASRASRARAPQFQANAKIEVSRVKAKNRGGADVPAVQKDCVKLMIPSVIADPNARCHEFEIVAKGKASQTIFRVLAEGFNHPLVSPRARAATPFVVSLDRLPADFVEFEVFALDSWWNKSKSLMAKLPA